MSRTVLITGATGALCTSVAGRFPAAGSSVNEAAPGTMGTPAKYRYMSDVSSVAWVTTGAVAAVLHDLSRDAAAASNGAAVAPPGPTLGP